jgi:hypothetical protein
MADGIKTLGCVISMSTEVGSPQTFVALGNVTDFSRSGPERNIIPTSNLSSTAATKIAGLLDEGEFNFTLNWDPALASHQAVVTAMTDGGVREFKIVLTDSGAAEIHFNGIVKSFPVNAPFDDKVTVNVGVAITGAAWITY